MNADRIAEIRERLDALSDRVEYQEEALGIVIEELALLLDLVAPPRAVDPPEAAVGAVASVLTNLAEVGGRPTTGPLQVDREIASDILTALVAQGCIPPFDFSSGEVGNQK